MAAVLTSTMTVQLEFAGMAMPVKVTLFTCVFPELGIALAQVPRPAPM